MSLRVGDQPNVVISLDAWRRGVRDPEQLRVDAGYQEAKPEVHQPNEMGGWGSVLVRMGSDASITPGPYELDMPRYEKARARFFENYEDFQGWVRATAKKMLEHCACLGGYTNIHSEDLNAFYNAYASGELRIRDFQFKEGMHASPHEDELMSALHHVEEGIRSPSLDVARDSLILASDLLQALSYKDLTREAKAVRDAAISFMYASDDSRDAARVALALDDLSSRISSVSDDRVQAEISQTLMDFVGSEDSVLNRRAVTTLAVLKPAAMMSQGLSLFLKRA